MKFANDRTGPCAEIIEEVWARATHLTEASSDEADIVSLRSAVAYFGIDYPDQRSLFGIAESNNALNEDIVRCLQLGLDQVFPLKTYSIQSQRERRLGKNPWSDLAWDAFAVGDHLVSFVESATGYTLVERDKPPWYSLIQENQLRKLNGALEGIKTSKYHFAEADEAIDLVRVELTVFYDEPIEPSARIIKAIKDYFPEQFT